MSSAGPIWGADLWRRVVTAASERCQCAGECGRAHAKTGGRCDFAEGRRSEHLIVTPRQPAPFHVAARLPARELIALCGACHTGRTRALNRTAPTAPANEALF